MKFYETTPILPVGPNPYKGIIKEFPRDPTMVVRGFSGWLYDEERADINWLLTDPTPPWLEDVHNKYSGRCFLFGTGPSIVKQLPLLRKMKDEYVFTCNRMKRWDDFPLNPFVHCVTEPQPFLEWGSTIVPDYDHPRAQNRVGCMWWPIRVPGWLWLPKAPEEIQMRWHGVKGFDEQFCAVPTGWASPLTILQLAAWMGFREFYFLGCDTSQDGQAWDVTNGRTVYPRNIRSILECFDRARIDIKLAGAKVYDCAPGGRLNQEGVLEYMDLAEVLHD